MAVSATAAETSPFADSNSVEVARRHGADGAAGNNNGWFYGVGVGAAAMVRATAGLPAIGAACGRLARV
jgi:hypothetical protein